MQAIHTSATPPLAEPPGLVHVPTQTLPIRFTGSGSEYLRIWVINLLLTLLTLSLYWPFARARRITYFHNNTLIGDDPLGFHADPWKMFLGHLAMLLLTVPGALLSGTDPALAGLLLLVFMLAWPALWRASLKYRLRNTSWRGVPLAFAGDLRGAYAALLPLLLPMLALGLVLPQRPGDEPLPALQWAHAGAAPWLIGAIGLLLAPWGLARLKRYQHGNCVFAGERSELRVGAGAFYAESLRSSAVLLLMAFLLGCLALLLTIGWGHAFARQFDDKLPRIALWFGLPVLCCLLVPLVLLPYTSTRLHNLLWANTRSRHTHFRSELCVGTLVRMHVANWLLIALTLGLYWPFAQVRLARARLEAMSLQIRGDVDRWLYGPRARLKP